MPTQPRKATTESKLGRNTATTRRKAADEETPQTAGKGRATPRRAPAARRSRSSAQADPAPAPVAPAQPAAEDRYAPTAWGTGSVTGPQDLEMPSGQIALVRKPGIQQLMVEGVLHKMDSLSAMVDKKLIKKGRNGEENVDVLGLLRDEGAMADILHTVDRVVVACVIKPPITMPPNDPTARQAGVIYTDTVDLVDKMFIFNWVTGATRDLESFRRESEAVVGSLSVGEPLPDEAE